MTQPPEYVARPYQPVHTTPASSYQWQGMSQEQLNGLRTRLIESILQIIVQAVTGFFIPGGGIGGAFQQISGWVETLLGLTQLDDLVLGHSTGIQVPFTLPATLGTGSPIEQFFALVNQFLGLDFTSDNFDLAEIAEKFISDILNPTQFFTDLLGLLGNPTGLGTGAPGVPDLSDIPFIGPILALFGGSVTSGQANNFFTSLLQLLGSPTGMVAGTPVLPDLSNIPILADLQDVVDNIWDAFDTGTFGNSTGNPVLSVFQAIFGIFGTGSNAQAVNIIQDTRLDALAGGGSALSDAFDGAAASALNSTNWSQLYSGSGSGTCGLSGDGFCVWNTSGSSARICYNTFKTVTGTDTQSVAAGLSANIAANSGADSAMVLFGRSTLDTSDQVVALITDSTAEIGYVISNAYTRLGAAVSLTTDTNGTWQLKLGTATDDREFVLLRNGSTVISRTDTGDASFLDSSHRYTGFAMQAGWNFSVFFGFPVQVAPPPIGAWAASDRDPAT